MIPGSILRDRTEAQDDGAAGAWYMCLAEGTSVPTRGHCLSAHFDCLLHLLLGGNLLKLCSSLAPETVNDDGGNSVRVE
jgi:hypothetical protein